MKTTASPTVAYGFLLLPGFSLIAFSTAVEPLRMANRIAHAPLYCWQVFTLDGKPVTASCGITLEANAQIEDMEKTSVLFICSGINVRSAITRELTKFLKKLARNKMMLGGICTGSYVLAKAGLLDKYKVATHWENIPGMREEFPQVVLTQQLFAMDKDRYTSSGGTAPLDLMLNLIRPRVGPEIVAQICDQFNMDRVRDAHDEQHVPLKVRIGSYHRSLLKIAALMEDNIESPLAMNELAKEVGVSRRQVERLFRNHLHVSPTRYYLDLRLQRARDLLLQTSMSIMDVTIACGFQSPPHFSKCYRAYYGYPPSHERNLGGGDRH